MLKRAAGYGDRLIVGVSTDALNETKKGRPAVYSQEERVELVSALRFVDDVFLEESLEKMREYVSSYDADVLEWETIGKACSMTCGTYARCRTCLGRLPSRQRR
jgi:cytidyltransferase-like protein